MNISVTCITSQSPNLITTYLIHQFIIFIHPSYNGHNFSNTWEYSNTVWHQPSHLKNCVYVTFNDTPNHSSSGSFYPVSNFISYYNLYLSQYSSSISITVYTELKTYSEATKFGCWNQVMKTKLDNLNKTSFYEGNAQIMC